MDILAPVQLLVRTISKPLPWLLLILFAVIEYQSKRVSLPFLLKDTWQGDVSDTVPSSYLNVSSILVSYNVCGLRMVSRSRLIMTSALAVSLLTAGLLRYILYPH